MLLQSNNVKNECTNQIGRGSPNETENNNSKFACLRNIFELLLLHTLTPLRISFIIFTRLSLFFICSICSFLVALAITPLTGMSKIMTARPEKTATPADEMNNFKLKQDSMPIRCRTYLKYRKGNKWLIQFVRVKTKSSWRKPSNPLISGHRLTLGSRFLPQSNFSLRCLTLLRPS